jgi:glycosyltransferase involved in cell wall biosynthesis
MNYNQPLVSAIIPTKNRPEMLRRALQSVAMQSYAPIEIIVVDDGSTDHTKAVVDAFNETYDLSYIKNDTSQGAPRARNQGIEAANGVFVAGLDDDDEWHPQRIERLMQAHKDSFSCVTSDLRMQYVKRSAVWRKKRIISLDALLYSNQVGNQVLVKRDRLLSVGGFDEQLSAAQDYDLWIRLCQEYGSIKNVKKPLQTVHTEHKEGRISNPATQLEGYLKFYKKHKHRMNKAQRKYQLYNIRRAQGKHPGLLDMMGWVPRDRYAKETKRWVADRFLSGR